MKSHSIGHRVFSFLLLAGLMTIAGCGGEDPLSQPDSSIADRLAKAKESATEKPPEIPNVSPVQSAKPPAAVASADSDSATESPADDSSAADDSPFEDDAPVASSSEAAGSEPADTETAATAEPASPKPKSLLDQLSSRPKPDAATDPDPEPDPEPETASAEPARPEVAPQDRAAAASLEGETMTAGGKTKEQIERDQQDGESVASAGLSLLDKLRGTDEPKKQKRSAPTPQKETVLARTGRFAIAAKTWLSLQTELARRFYVSATADGAKIAASSGERSLGVLSTQVESLGEERVFTRTTNNVLAQTRTKKQVITQPVRSLPGYVSAIELLEGGDVVAIGTYDGRILGRTGANIQDWDLYAQDLFAFQDERRPASRIYEGPVEAIRAITPDRLLTISEGGKCAIWKTSDVVHPPKPALEMTEEEASQPEAQVLTPSPLAEVPLQDSRILNLVFSASRQYCGIVMSNETITVFNTETGEIIDTLSAAHLDDTQPVSAILEEDRMRIVVGLADGRIFRRALKGGERVTGSDDKGNTVDYETIFTPDLGDEAGAITAMELKYDGRLMYMGRLDGSVTHFDLPRKQPIKTVKLHSAPVIEMRSTRAGVFTIGADRIAKLSDTVPGSTVAAETFNLPRDSSLQEKEVVDDGKTTRSDKFTRARNFGRKKVEAANDDVTAAGIRPADPVLALYEHQLRVASDMDVRGAIREKVRKIKKPLDEDPLKQDTVPGEGEVQATPRQFAEILTDLDYKARPLRRAVMSVSNDGTTLAAAQYYRQAMQQGKKPNQPVMVWDTITETMLRTWRRSPGVMDLDIHMEPGLILPTPMSAQLHLYSGEFMVDPNSASYLSWQVREDGSGAAVGLRGVKGVAQNMVQLLKRGGAVEYQGIEAFEGAVSSLAFSPDGSSLFANIRERTKIRLLELDGQNLEIKNELAREPVSGGWDPSQVNLESGVLGAKDMLVSPDGNLLLTYGRYESGFQMRVWKKDKDGKWPADQVLVLPTKENMIETVMSDTPIVFVDGGEEFLAIMGTKGVGVIDLESGRVHMSLPLPDVENRRPVTLLTPDGKFAMAGDREGRVWVWWLNALDQAPGVFTAQAGPITGLAVSRNGRYLATAGEENRVRVWDLKYVMSEAPRKSRRRR